MKKTILLLGALTALSSAQAAIVVETQQLDIQNMHNTGSIGISLADETGGNTSSLLVVGTTHRFSDVTSAEVTLTRGASTFTADLFQSNYNAGIGNAFYIFDLGDAGAGEAVTLNNISSVTARESFTVLQLSGAALSGAQFASDSSDGNVFDTTFASDLDGGSFTFWIAGNQSKRTLDAVIPASADASNWNATAAAGNNAAGWAYDAGLSGTTTVGFDIAGNGNTSLLALNIQAVVPEPSTYAIIAGALALGIVMLRRRS